mmetsp:Transcript_6683/g.17033  ORF Transcript_6683/g.17033 Transcript_6683/m.17033 type:complete len:397 (+) Transcript_6683:1443-2633(+)
MVVQGVDHPIEPCHRGLVHHRRDQVRRVHDEARRLTLAPLHVLPKRIVTLRQIAILAPRGGLAELQLLLIKVLKAHLLDVQQLEEATLHLLLVTKGIVAQDEVKAGHEVKVLRTMHQQVLIRVNGVRELVHLEERVADVAHDLEPNGLHIVWDLVKRHAVHLDGSRPLLLLEVDVSHVHTEATAEGILFVLHDLRVDGQRLVVVIVGLVLNCKVQADCIREVNVELVEQVLRLPEPAKLALFLSCLLALLQSLPQVALLTCDGTLLHQPVDFLLHLAQLFLLGQLRLLLQGLCWAAARITLVQGIEDSLRATLLARSSVPGSTIRGHGARRLGVAGAEATSTLRHCRHPASARCGSALHVRARWRLVLHMVEVVLGVSHTTRDVDAVAVVIHELLL